MTPEAFVIENLFQVVNKDREEVPFQLNSAQRSIDEAWSFRNLIPKARQEGVSTYVLARFTVICMSRPNTRAVVISHEREATERMLEKVDFFLSHLKSPPAVLSNDSKSEITFKKTGSSFYIGTAGAKAFGRGDTISHLHCSEVAFWPDPKKQVLGLFQAVPHGGEINVESTGNGRGNWYHNQCLRALEGKSRFKLHFLPWHTFDEYRYPVGEEEAASILGNLLDELDEPEAVERYGLTADRLAWRREKLEEMEYDLAGFNQEYPSCLDDCFQSSGASFFHKITYQETKEWKLRRDIMNGLSILGEHPFSRKSYALGVDVSGGVGKDYSVIEIIDLERGEQVGEYRNNRIDPEAFAFVVETLARLFNNAFVTVESNNHGLLTLSTLVKTYPRDLVYRVQRTKGPDEIGKLADLGIRTTSKTKPYMLGKLRKDLAQGFIIHSPVAKAELDAFCEDEAGKLGAPSGAFDDCVLALACGNFTIERAILATAKPEQRLVQVFNPFELDSIINEMQRRRSGYPITPKVI